MLRAEKEYLKPLMMVQTPDTFEDTLGENQLFQNAQATVEELSQFIAIIERKYAISNLAGVAAFGALSIHENHQLQAIQDAVLTLIKEGAAIDDDLGELLGELFPAVDSTRMMLATANAENLIQCMNARSAADEHVAALEKKLEELDINIATKQEVLRDLESSEETVRQEQEKALNQKLAQKRGELQKLEASRSAYESRVRWSCAGGIAVGAGALAIMQKLFVSHK